MRNKNIVIIGPIPPPIHGVSIFTDKILKAELKRYFKLIHLDTTDRRNTPNIGRLDFVNVYIALRSIFFLIYYLIEYKPLIVYIPISQNTLGFLRDGIFILVSRFLGAKVIIHLHGGIFDVFYRNSVFIYKLFIKICFRFVNTGIVLCDRFKNIFGDLIEEKDVKIVSNGIDIEIPDDKFIARMERIRNEKDKIKIVFLGTLDKRKGFIDVIHAANYVIKETDNVEFIIAGGWYFQKDKEEALELIEKYNIGEKVLFPGPVRGEDKWKLLSDAHIFVFPTYYFAEGQPLVILEAMMAGLPVISTRRGCLKNMIKEGINGFTVAEGDIKGISEKILLLINNRALLMSISENNRKEFLENYME
uniref:Glycosyltransferase family 1 protein n=1 Tax=candidate division WOR-3 bacterium TaxID=2052148 RepID=A0A7C4YHV1_UNCW3